MNSAQGTSNAIVSCVGNAASGSILLMMTNTVLVGAEAQLLSQLAEQADRDEPRLAYARWCAVNDQPEKAEFIRIQCRQDELANSPAQLAMSFTEHGELLRTENAILDRCSDTWLKELQARLPSVQHAVYHRGFPDQLILDGYKFSADVDRLQVVVPTVRHLVLKISDDVPVPETVLASLGSQAIDRMHGLLLSGWWGNEAARRISGSRSVSNLTHLGLCGSGLSAIGAVAILQSKNLCQLKSLNLSGNPLGFDAAWLISEMQTLPAPLEILDLSGTKLGDVELSLLAESPALNGLHELVLDNLSVQDSNPAGGTGLYSENRFTDEGVQFLLNSRILRNTSLHLHPTDHLSHEVVNALEDRNASVGMCTLAKC